MEEIQHNQTVIIVNKKINLLDLLSVTDTHGLVMLWLDYCNVLYVGLFSKTIHPETLADAL